MKLIFGTLFAVLAVTNQIEKQMVIDWSNVKPVREVNNELRKLVKRPIVGGTESKKSQFPYQAGLLMSLLDFKIKTFCGGSLISSNRVITAAHCINDAISVLVILGAHMIQEEEPTQVKIDVPKSGLLIHPEYVNGIVFNDIAMIKLPTKVIFNDEISPIELPDGMNDYSGENAVLTGWGYFDESWKKSPILRFVSLKVITNSACLNDLPTFVKDSIICANENGIVGACKADSGGPLAIQSNEKSILVGVAVFVSGVLCDSGLPTGFSRVTSFIPWIKENML